MTKGSPTADHWVTTFTLRYSEDDGQTWEWYPGEFPANHDGNTEVYIAIEPPITATTVQLHPKTKYGAIALRAELYGCTGDHVPEGHWKHCADEGELCEC